MGFYGNLANVARTTFSFDKTYSTHFEMMLESEEDQVFIGRYVLLDYDYEDNENDDIYNIVKLVQWIRTYRPGTNWDIVEKKGSNWKEIAFPENRVIQRPDSNTYYIVVSGDATFKNPKLYLGENEHIFNENDPEDDEPLPTKINDWYRSHYDIDKKIFDSVGRGWDSTVWQKTYKDDRQDYVMIAELNGVVPTIDILNDPPVWLSDLAEILDDQDHEKVYRMNKSKPYFDEEDRTNLYYRLHVQSPWKFGLNTMNLKPSANGTDNVTLTYTKSDQEYSYEIGTTDTAFDTMNFNFNFPSIGNALKDINDLLYGTDYYDDNGPNWNKIIDPVGKREDRNKISYYPQDNSETFNTNAFQSVAGALNTIYKIVDANITKNLDNGFPEGMIFYGKFKDLADAVNETNIDNADDYNDDNNKYYWYQYIDKDNSTSIKKYRRLEGYPSYSNILQLLAQSAADAIDTVDDLRKLANETRGVPNTLLITDSDYRVGGVNLSGDNIINISDFQYTPTRNYLPYPNWSMIENGQTVHGKTTLNGLTFVINNDDKTFTVNGKATYDTELVIAYNVYLPQGTYVFSGSFDGSNSTDETNKKKYGLKAIKEDNIDANDYIIYNGKTNITITSSNFYFDYVSVFIGKNSELNNQIFKPMIRLQEGIEDSTAVENYTPYTNEYTLNISHKEVETGNANIKDSEYNLLDDGAEIDEISALYEPTIDNYGHVIKLKKGLYPKAFTELNLITEKQKTTIGNNNNEVNIVPLEYLAKNSDKLSFTLNGVEIEQVPQEQGDYSNIELNIKTTNYPFAIGNIDGIENDYTNPLISNLSFDNTNKVLNATYLNYPYPLSFISVGPLPQSVDNNDRIINWTNNTPGNERQYIYTPTKKNITYISQKMYDNAGHLIESRTDSAVGKVISFSPADDYIKLGVLKDANAGDNIGNEAVVVGHSLKSTDNFNASNYFGEINNLFPRQRSRLALDGTDAIEGVGPTGVISDKDTFFSYSKITEKINLTPKENENGVFSTLSLKFDQAGHIAGIQEVNVKLILESVLSSFIKPKPISKFSTLFYHNRCVDDTDQASLAPPGCSGAYFIGDRIYLLDGESIKNYTYIAVRIGVYNLSPAGGGHKFEIIPSAYLQKENTWNSVYSIGKGWYSINFRWFAEKDQNNNLTGKEYLEITGNSSFYHVGKLRGGDEESHDTWQGPNNFYMTAGVREYASDINSKATATVSSDESKANNPNSWLYNDPSAWDHDNGGAGEGAEIYRVKSPYWPENDPNHGWFSSLEQTRAAQTPAANGIRQIFGIGPNFTAMSADDDLDPPSDQPEPEPESTNSNS